MPLSVFEHTFPSGPVWHPGKWLRARSGDYLADIYQPQEFIGCQSQYTEHEMGHHFGPASDANHPTAKLIFEPPIDPLYICPFFIPVVFGQLKMDEFQTTSFSFQFFFQLGVPT